MFNLLSSSINVTMAVIWIIVIAVSIILEEQTAQLVSIWFGVGAIGAIICVLADLDVVTQVLVFAISSLILVFLSRPLAKKMMQNTEIKTNADRLIGMKGRLTKAITEDEKGEIKIDYQKWTAVSIDNKPINENELVVVKEISGNKLVVDIIEEIQIK